VLRYIVLLKKTVGVTPQQYCVADDIDCAEWLRVHYSGARHALGADMFAKLDEYVDNSDGKLNGKIRYANATTEHYLYVQGRSRVK